MKLQIFTNKNVSLLFLSPYALRYHSTNGSSETLRQELFGTAVTTDGFRATGLDNLMERLDSGISYPDLIAYLKNVTNIPDPEPLVREWMAKGILE